MGELYAEVRLTAATDPAAAHVRWKEVREGLYRDHPASPVASGRRAQFRALHFEYDPRLRFELPIRAEAMPVGDPAPTRATPAGMTEAGPGEAALPTGDSTPGGPASNALPFGLKLPISTGQPLGFERVGRLEVPFEGRPRRLTLFWLPEYSGGFFLPFRDGTNGHETYGGGRYLLDTAKGADLGGDPSRSTIVVDFNFAYQPSCAFDPRWSCPLAPPENRLDIEVRAGERIA